ncbi:MAG: hypothetical protein R2855_06175 [Thermomicrobiales bacterium]
MNSIPSPRIRFRRSRAIDAFWLVFLAILALWVFHRLGAFDLWNQIPLPDGTTERFVRTFGAADHPFHATRAELLRRSLASGEVMRWVSAHQGGYPVEFYPLGAPAFEVLIWAAMLGALPMMAAHKLAVIVIFLLPALGYLLLAREDRIPLGVGVLALVFHISVRGFWWSGGYWELVDWGLVSSSLAMTALLAFLPISFHAVRARSIRWGACASIVAAFAVYTNVRSFIPLAAIAIGMIASLCWESDRREHLRGKVTAAAAIVVMAGLLAAPLLIALARYNDLYFFVVYERYDSLREYWDASMTAVSRPILWLGLSGLALAFIRPELRAGRFVAFTTITYFAVTILLSGLMPGPHIEQLEATRLMPFQRALTFFLAALAVYVTLALLADLIKRYRLTIVNLGLVAGTLLTLLLYIFVDSSPVPESDRALYPVLNTGDSYMLDQQHAVELANERDEPGTAILVLGSILSWHDQFWSIEWSERPFYFDDWLWYWQKDLAGEYNPEREHVYPDPATTLDPEFLSGQGIGAVVVFGRALDAARSSTALESISDSGTYSVFLVRDPTPVITADGAETTEIDLENQRYSATVSQPSTTFEVRRNWFPRWTATVDGRPADITKDANGFMTVTASEPGTRVELVYGVDGWDWLGRILLLAGMASAAVAIVQPRRVERFLKIESSGN